VEHQRRDKKQHKLDSTFREVLPPAKVVSDEVVVGAASTSYNHHTLGVSLQWNNEY
jgi:hypothetical protein